MFENPRKVIQNQELFSKNDRLLVAVSGGLDSMVLIEVLYELGYRFSIAHCNYQLRIPDSDQDELFIKTWAESRNILCHVAQKPLTESGNIQDQARTERYAFFNQLVKEYHYQYIVTAHHANDQVEGFFLQLSRGSGLNGLKGMNPKSGLIRRPFLNLSKHDLLHYAQEQSIAYRIDSSNLTDKYLRNYFRNAVIPEIEQRVPAFQSMVLRSIAHLQELFPIVQNAYFEWKSNHLEIKPSEIIIRSIALSESYFLSIYLSDLEFHPNTIDQIKNALSEPGKIFYSKTNLELAIHTDHIKIRKSSLTEQESEYFIHSESGELTVKHGTIKWNKRIYDKAPLIFEDSKCIFDFDEIQFPLKVRTWQSGDKLQVFGMNGKHKKVQDLFTDHKIGIFDKQKIYLLCSNETILWVCGLQRSDHAKIKPGTRSILDISFQRNQVF